MMPQLVQKSCRIQSENICNLRNVVLDIVQAFSCHNSLMIPEMSRSSLSFRTAKLHIPRLLQIVPLQHKITMMPAQIHTERPERVPRPLANLLNRKPCRSVERHGFGVSIATQYRHINPSKRRFEITYSPL